MVFFEELHWNGSALCSLPLLKQQAVSFLYNHNAGWNTNKILCFIKSKCFNALFDLFFNNCLHFIYFFSILVFVQYEF